MKETRERSAEHETEAVAASRPLAPASRSAEDAPRAAAPASAPVATAPLAYLLAQYPAVNHTYLLREVRALRALGLDVRVASVRRPDRPDARLSGEEREEAARTFYVKPAGLRALLAPHLLTLLKSPLAYLRGLAYTLRLSLAQPAKAPHQWMYLTEALVLARWMRRVRASHVHSHFTTNVCLAAAHLFPVTISMTIHGPEEFEDAPGFRLAEKVKKALFVAAISNYARSQLMRVSEWDEWGKIEVAPLGVDPSVFAPREARAGEGAFEIICVGRLAPVKGHHVLMAAMERLVREGRDVVLRVVGDGPSRAALEEDARRRGLDGRVIFEGALNQERVRELYGRADAFALASFAEGVPVVLMEAMAMEIPCVATCVNGVPELIRDGVDGLLVAPSDEEALTRTLASLMDDATLGRRLGASARRRVVEKYNLARNAARLAEIFRRRVLDADAASASHHYQPSEAHSGAGARYADTTEYDSEQREQHSEERKHDSRKREHDSHKSELYSERREDSSDTPEQHSKRREGDSRLWEHDSQLREGGSELRGRDSVVWEHDSELGERCSGSRERDSESDEGCLKVGEGFSSASEGLASGGERVSLKGEGVSPGGEDVKLRRDGSPVRADETYRA